MRHFVFILGVMVCLLVLLLWPTFSMLITIGSQFALISSTPYVLIALFIWNNILLGIIIRLLFSAKTTWQKWQTGRLLDQGASLEKASVIDCWEDYSDPELSNFFVTLQFEDLFAVEIQIPEKIYRKIEMDDIVPVHCLADNPNIFRPDWENKRSLPPEAMTYSAPSKIMTNPVDGDKNGYPG